MINPAATRLYWTSDMRAKELPDESKSIGLREVTEIRRGSDPDPDHAGQTGTDSLRRHKLTLDQLDCCFSLITRDRLVLIKMKQCPRYYLYFNICL